MLDVILPASTEFGINNLCTHDWSCIVFEILVLRVCSEEWNTEFHPSLKRTAEPQDIHINRNRLSGFWGGTGIEDALRKRDIRTLLFAGENTDQCVAGTIRDAYTKGWDCLMLSDACATTSPEFTKKCTEYNCEGG
ncbi:Isochorismatase-like protein [Fusarium oxysporum II5]|nr:Isochorismatase-like protein [Fusarium oxysporum II5]